MRGAATRVNELAGERDERCFWRRKSQLDAHGARNLPKRAIDQTKTKTGSSLFSIRSFPLYIFDVGGVTICHAFPF